MGIGRDAGGADASVPGIAPDVVGKIRRAQQQRGAQQTAGEQQKRDARTR
jgi:hypothetical protein